MIKDWLKKSEKDKIIAKVGQMSVAEVKQQTVSLLNELESDLAQKTAFKAQIQAEEKAHAAALKERREKNLLHKQAYKEKMAEIKDNLARLTEEDQRITADNAAYRDDAKARILDLRNKQNAALATLQNESSAAQNTKYQAFKADKEVLDADFRRQKERMKAKYGSEAALVRQDLAELKDKALGRDEEHQQELAAMSKEYQAEIDKHRQEVNNLKEINQNIRKQIDETKKGEAMKIAELQAEKEAAMKKLIADSRAELAALAEKGQVDEKALKEILQNLLLKEKELRNQLADAENVNSADRNHLTAEYQIELNKLNEEEETRQKKYQDLLTSYNRAFTEFKKHNEDFKNEKSAKEQEISALKAELSETLNAKRAENTQKLAAALKEQQTNLAEYRTKLSALLAQEKSAAAKELQLLKEDFAKEEARQLATVADLNKDKVAKAAIFKTELNNLQDEINKLNRDKLAYDNTQAADLKAAEAKINDLLKERKAETDKLSAELTEKRKALAATLAQKKAALLQDKAAQLKTNEALDTALTSLLKERENFIQQNELKKAAAQSDHDNRLANIQKNIALLTRYEEELTTKINETQAEHTARLAALEDDKHSLANEHSLQLAKLTEEGEKALTALKAQYTQLEADEEAAYKNKLALLTEESKQKKETLLAANTVKLNKYQNDIEALKKTITLTSQETDELVAKAQAKKAELEETLVTAQSAYEAKAQALNAELVDLKAKQNEDLSTVNAQHNTALNVLYEDEKQFTQAIYDECQTLKAQEAAKEKELTEKKAAVAAEKDSLNALLSAKQAEYAQKIAQAEEEHKNLLETYTAMKKEQEALSNQNKLDLAAKEQELAAFKADLAAKVKEAENTKQTKLADLERELKAEFAQRQWEQDKKIKEVEELNRFELNRLINEQLQKEVDYLNLLQVQQLRHTDINDDYRKKYQEIKAAIAEDEDRLAALIRDSSQEIDTLRSAIKQQSEDNETALKKFKAEKDDEFANIAAASKVKLAAARENNTKINTNIINIQRFITDETIAQKHFKEEMDNKLSFFEKLYAEKLKTVQNAISEVKLTTGEIIHSHDKDLNDYKKLTAELAAKQKELSAQNDVTLNETAESTNIALGSLKAAFNKDCLALENKLQEVIKAAGATQDAKVAEAQLKIAELNTKTAEITKAADSELQQYAGECQAELAKLAETAAKYDISIAEEKDYYLQETTLLRSKLTSLKEEHLKRRQAIIDNYDHSLKQILAQENEESLNLSSQKKELLATYQAKEDELASILKAYHTLQESVKAKAEEFSDNYCQTLQDFAKKAQEMPIDGGELAKKRDILVGDNEAICNLFK